MEGYKDRNHVGSFDGLLAGVELGLPVGNNDGSFNGFSDGISEGVYIGDFEGNNDGRVVVGDADGKLDEVGKLDGK